MPSLWISGKTEELVVLKYLINGMYRTEEKPISEIKSHRIFIGKIVSFGADLKRGEIVSESFQVNSFYVDENIDCYNNAHINRIRLEFREDGSLRMYGLEGLVHDERFKHPNRRNKELFFFNNGPAEFQGNYIPQDFWPRDMPSSINDVILENVIRLLGEQKFIDENSLLENLELLENQGPSYDEKKGKYRFFIL